MKTLVYGKAGMKKPTNRLYLSIRVPATMAPTKRKVDCVNKSQLNASIMSIFVKKRYQIICKRWSCHSHRHTKHKKRAEVQKMGTNRFAVRREVSS